MPKTFKTKYGSADEGFKKVVERRAEKIASASKKEREENENKILYEIAKSGPEGINQKDLARKTELNEETIRLHAIDLMEKGLITKKGKQGNYKLTSFAAKDFRIQSMVFGYEAVKEIMNSFTHFMSSNYSKRYEEDALKEIEIRNRICNNVNSKEKALLEFAMDMGALITYVMLKAMEHSKEQDKNNYLDNSLTWLKQSINPIVMLKYFEKIAKEMIKKHYLESDQNVNYLSQSNKNENKNKSNNLDNNSLYSLNKIDKNSYNIMEKAFREIWPYTFDALEDIQLRIPKIAEDGTGSAYKNTKKMEEFIEKRENLRCFKSQQIVKIITLSYLERLNKSY
jgi:hypothetical protein